MTKILVEKDSYFDSVFLMQINRQVKELDGISEAVVSMATEMNLDLLEGLGFTAAALKSATPNDLVIGILGDDEEAVDNAVSEARKLLKEKKSTKGAQHQFRPPTLDSAVRTLPEANLVVVSVPGRYAAREAFKALRHDLHVMLFSDNVSVDDEIGLKKLAVERGLLMMGPDCGTAILNGKAICFANVVPRGDIGVVAASGTGLQEITCGIARMGGGVSQAIGTGGRDLSAKVGGRMMLTGIQALSRDPATKVIAVVSKPPAAEVADKVIDALARTGKPVVIDFIGLEKHADEGIVAFASNLEEAAGRAVAFSAGKMFTPYTFSRPDEEILHIVERETGQMNGSQTYLRGLFTGGTLADEALYLMDSALNGVYSNNQKILERTLKDPHNSVGHTIVDLGDDIFTVGRPHPMIDPSTREERILKESEDPEVAVMLLDIVLGYGSHESPAGAIAESLKHAKEKASTRGGYLSIVTSITGTSGDYQNLDTQRRLLEDVGCIVMPSNYQASMLALKILEAKKS